jgi:hypothetical protein
MRPELLRFPTPAVHPYAAEAYLDPVIEEQIKAVPQRALRPLAGSFTLRETAPGSGQPFNPRQAQGNMLTHAFGAS